MGASNSGGGKANRRGKDQAQAAYMKAHPGRFPDSESRPWRGEGVGARELSRQMGSVQNNSAKWHLGMLGGVLAARLGYGWNGIPSDLHKAA